MIVGANGAGKSTILDALTFSLFGKAFRKINKPGLINSINNKDCRVEVEFSVNNKKYKVVRGIKPNIFEIYCAGVLVNQDSTAKDYQDYLEKSILRMNFKSFTQIVILGSASFTPFMQLSPADRRVVIEDLLDIQIFSVMNTIVKQRSQTNRDQLERNRIENLGRQETKDYIEKMIVSLQVDDQKRLNELTQDAIQQQKIVDKLDKEILELTSKREELLTSTGKYANLNKRNKKLISLKSQIETNLKRHRCDHSFYQEYDNCPTCRQSIDDGFREQESGRLALKIEEMENALIDINVKICDCEKEIVEVESILSEADSIRSNISAHESKKNQILDNITKIKENIRSLSEYNQLLVDNQNKLTDLVTKIQESETARKKLLEDKQYIDSATNLLKDGGIKTRIIKQYLPIINKLINKYLIQMNFYVSFNLDENFNESIKSGYRDEFSYQNFSEGEKTRINLALLFAWRAVAKVKNSVSTNILIFDEIFDGSLDDSGTEEFLKIITDLSGESNIFVISHKVDQMLDKFEKVYRFQKMRNYSTLT